MKILPYKIFNQYNTEEAITLKKEDFFTQKVLFNIFLKSKVILRPHPHQMVLM